MVDKVMHYFCCLGCNSSPAIARVKGRSKHVSNMVSAGSTFALGNLQKCVGGFLLYKFWRIFPGIFLEDFSGHFFPTKMRRENPATKSLKKSSGPIKKKSAKNPFCRKPALSISVVPLADFTPSPNTRAMPLSHYVSQGLASYRCCTPAGLPTRPYRSEWGSTREGGIRS